MATVTRAHLSEAVYEEVGLSRADSAKLVASVLDKVADALAEGDAVKISSFGSFMVRDKAQRVGRNPKTGETVTISARRVVVWRPSATLREAMRDGGVDPALADRKPE